MRLGDLLGPRRVLIPLEAESVEQGIELLAQACIADGRVSDAGKLRRVIAESRPEDTVSLGPQSWLSHFRTDAVPNLVAALGVAPRPVQGGREGGEARIMLLIIAPLRDPGTYLRAVASFARALARPEVADGLLTAQTAEQVLRLPALGGRELPGPALVRDVMTHNVAPVSPDLPVARAAERLLTEGAGGLPVVGAQGELLGMLTQRDVLRHLVPAYLQRTSTGEVSLAGGRTPVRDAMTRNVLCVSEDTPLADVAQLMANKDVERIPVVTDGRLRGVLTRSSVMRSVLGDMK